MRSSSSQGFRKTITNVNSNRPRTSVNKRSIDVYSQVIPLHTRIKKAYHMSTKSELAPSYSSSNSMRNTTKQRVDSDQP